MPVLVPIAAAAALAAGPAIGVAVGSAIAGSLIAAALSVAITVAGQALFGGQTSQKQSEDRTRKFSPHPLFRFAFGEFPQEGEVVFHHAAGQRYYVAYLLNSVPSHDRAITRIEINDGIELDVPGLQQAENADYNGVLVLQDITDMDLGAGAEDPGPFGVSDAPDVKFWLGTGEHTQAPQQWLDEIGPGGTGVLQSTDIWKGATVLFARFVDDNPKLRAQRYPISKPPPLRIFGKWSKLYDPRLDPTSGVTQIGNTVLGKQAAPPGSPSDGDSYIVEPGATGDWAGQDNDIATWDATASPAAWTFASPTNGDQHWVLDESIQYTWDTSVSPSAWVAGQVAHDIDDRTTWEWSQNPALAGLMLATHEFALGFDQEMIPIQQWADAADDCDDEFSSASTVLVVQPANDRLHLKFTGEDGVAGPSDIVDSSPVGRTPNIVGNVQIQDNRLRLDVDGIFQGIQYDDLEVSDVNPRDKEFDFRAKIAPDLITPTQPTMTIMSDDTSSTVRSFALRVLGDGTLNFIGWGDEGNGGSTSAADVVIDLRSAPGTIAFGGALQACRVWREGDDWRMSVGGTEVASDLNHPATLHGASADLRRLKIGLRSNNLEPYKGFMDDVQIVINQTIDAASSDPWGCNGLVLIRERELDLLTPVLDCMAGHLDTADGLLGVRAGVWHAPTETLTQPLDDELELIGAEDAGFDTVRAKFIWPGAEWEETDGPGYALRAGNRVHPLHLPLVAAHEQAAKLEKIFALRAEPNRRVNATWDGRELNRRIGERLSFSLSEVARATSTYAITGKAPTTRALDDGFEAAVGLEIVEDVAATYAWTIADYTPPSTFTNPAQTSPSLAAPTAVVAEQRNVRTGDEGAEARLRVEITISQATSEAASEIVVQTNDSGGTMADAWAALATIAVEPGQTTYVAWLNPAAVGVTYQVRAATRGGDFGQSDWLLSNSVTIIAPTLDYSAADYSAEYA